MTHEEIEKVAVELGNTLSYESYYIGSGYPAIEKAIDILTTYRAQVLEEVIQIAKEKRQEMLNTINDPKNILCSECKKNIKHGSICYTAGHCPKHPTN